MKSLGKNPSKELEGSYVESTTPEKIYFPSFYVDSKQMPDIDNWEVGKEYTITVKVKMCSYSLSEREDKSMSSAEIEVLEYATKTPKTLS